VSELDFNSKEGAQSHEFLIWERKNPPFKLSSDFKSFYSLFNGFNLQWKVNIMGKKVIVGDIHLNSLDLIQRQSSEGHSVMCETNSIYQPFHPQLCTVFALHAMGEYGQVMLVYRTERTNEISSSASPSPSPSTHSSTADPEIWFLDMSSRWHYLCPKFTHYLRILILHMGIIGWELAYTPEGLPDTSQQWMRLFCKERLCIDIHWLNTRKISGSNPSK